MTTNHEEFPTSKDAAAIVESLDSIDERLDRLVEAAQHIAEVLANMYDMKAFEKIRQEKNSVFIIRPPR